MDSQIKVPCGLAGLLLVSIRIRLFATAIVIGGNTIKLVASKPSNKVGKAMFTLTGDQIIIASSAATFEYIIDDQILTSEGSLSVLEVKIHLTSFTSEIIIGN